MALDSSRRPQHVCVFVGERSSWRRFPSSRFPFLFPLSVKDSIQEQMHRVSFPSSVFLFPVSPFPFPIFSVLFPVVRQGPPLGAKCTAAISRRPFSVSRQPFPSVPRDGKRSQVLRALVCSQTRSELGPLNCGGLPAGRRSVCRPVLGVTVSAGSAPDLSRH